MALTVDSKPPALSIPKEGVLPFYTFACGTPATRYIHILDVVPDPSRPSLRQFQVYSCGDAKERSISAMERMVMENFVQRNKLDGSRGVAGFLFRDGTCISIPYEKKEYTVKDQDFGKHFKPLELKPIRADQMPYDKSMFQPTLTVPNEDNDTTAFIAQEPQPVFP
jgi:hypothetical protein